MLWLKKSKRNKRAYEYMLMLTAAQEGYDECLLLKDWLMADFYYEQIQAITAEIHAFTNTVKNPQHDVAISRYRKTARDYRG